VAEMIAAHRETWLTIGVGLRLVKTSHQ
jgi:hypothetical protein